MWVVPIASFKCFLLSKLYIVVRSFVLKCIIMSEKYSNIYGFINYNFSSQQPDNSNGEISSFVSGNEQSQDSEQMYVV